VLCRVHQVGEELFEGLVRAWSDARNDLKIDVVAPFDLMIDDTELKCVALLRQFGFRNGMLVMDDSTLDETFGLAKVAVERGYGFSYLGRGFTTYQRESFIEALNDWSWNGDAAGAPDWYRGEFFADQAPG